MRQLLLSSVYDSGRQPTSRLTDRSSFSDVNFEFILIGGAFDLSQRYRRLDFTTSQRKRKTDAGRLLDKFKIDATGGYTRQLLCGFHTACSHAVTPSSV